MTAPSAPISRLVLASGNAGKLAELQAFFSRWQIEVRPQSDFDIDDVEETGATFIENALLKARHASRISGLPALADDSGLCVDALAGAPGLHSARYAGEHGNSGGNIDKLLFELRAVAEENRGAYFVCVLALLQHADDPAPLIAEGRWHGRVLTQPQGEGGFGYDPVFFDTELKHSAAELSAEEKLARSHRGRALQRLADLMNAGTRRT